MGVQAVGVGGPPERSWRTFIGKEIVVVVGGDCSHISLTFVFCLIDFMCVMLFVVLKEI